MLRALAVLVLGGTLLSCLLTPAVYSGLEALIGEVPWPYSRVFDRVALVVAVALVWLLRRNFRLQTLAPYYRDWRARGEWRRLLLGAGLALVTAVAALPWVVASGQLAWRPDGSATELLLLALGFVPAALLISVVEESFFRVLVFGKLREAWPTVAAALAASAFYAVLHFVSPDKDFHYSGWSFAVGFEYLGAMGRQFLKPGVPAGVVGLLLVGSVLCYALVRSGSLALCIGLHSGWVLAAKMTLHVARRAPGIEFPSGAGRRNFLVTRPECWATILVCAVVLWLVYRRRTAATAPDDTVARRPRP